MGLFARIKSALSSGRASGRRTNRGILFALDELEFVDETGEIAGCDYDYAAAELKRRLGGGVLPKELVSLLADYCEKPCLETALDLILFDARFLAFFVDNKRTKQFRKRIL